MTRQSWPAALVNSLVNQSGHLGLLKKSALATQLFRAALDTSLFARSKGAVKEATMTMATDCLELDEVEGVLRVRSAQVVLRPVEEALSSMRSPLTVWQVRALFLGAQASSQDYGGPSHLLTRITGPRGCVGPTPDDCDANLQSLLMLWVNLLRARPRLSLVTLSHPPTAAELVALCDRRRDEIEWFHRGFAEGGYSPLTLGPAGAERFGALADAAGLLLRYSDTFEEAPADELATANGLIQEVTAIIESHLHELRVLGETTRQQRPLLGGRTLLKPKVPRNDPCPCGSGRKWKRCCGSPS